MDLYLFDATLKYLYDIQIMHCGIDTIRCQPASRKVAQCFLRRHLSFLAKEELMFGNEPMIHLMKFRSSNNNQHPVED